MPHGADGELAQRVVLAVGERLARRDHNALARVHAHGIEVLHVAHHDAVVVAVAHHLVLDLLPADEVFLDQDLRAVRQRLLDACAQLRLIDAAARAQAAERVGNARHHRIADARSDGERLLQRCGGGAARHLDADLGEPRGEEGSVLRVLDGGNGRAEHRDAEFLQHTLLREGEPAVERRLPAEAKRDRVGALALDHLGDEVRRHREEIDALGKRGGGLHRGDVGIHEHRADALLLQRLHRLAAGIVELAGLADLQRAAAEQQHLAGRCFHRIMLTNSSKSRAESTGPGAASGWNCTLMNGRVR